MMGDNKPLPYGGRPPGPEELQSDEVEALKHGRVLRVERLGEPWRDDHIDCVAARFTIDGRDKPIDVSLWWCGAGIVGAISYAHESPTALADVVKEAQDNLPD